MFKMLLYVQKDLCDIRSVSDLLGMTNGIRVMSTRFVTVIILGMLEKNKRSKPGSIEKALKYGRSTT